MGQYSKFIVAAVGLALMLINQFFGVDLTGFSDQIVDAINLVVAIATAVGVHQVANAPSAAPKP